MDSIDNYQPWRAPTSCFVPSCPNTDIKNPNKIFVHIRKELKENWCKVVRRNIAKRHLYCCEDHIDLERDLENYEQFISGAKPKLKLSATPKNIPAKTKTKSRREHTVNPSTQPNTGVDNTSESTSNTVLPAAIIDAAVQCDGISCKSKAVMAKPKTATKSTNFRARQKKSNMDTTLTQNLEDEENLCPSVSLFGSSNIESSTSTGIIQEKEGREFLLTLIRSKPKMYLGLPKHFWWSVDYISKQHAIPSLHIILTLFKIKNNDSFVRMSDQFEISKSTIRLLFEKTVNILASFFQNFIYLPPLAEIKKNLPLVFKIRYSNVQCIIDCFEIQIEKPSDPVKQAQTWSQYKSCNTIKYLVGCTPAGMVTFISRGFGGRISDKAITAKSGFVDILPPNAVVMADRGFKEVESLLSVKNVKLLRPPSVYNTKKMTKKEVIETKVIASLRIHVERIIRRLREFHMLKPHSVINNKHIKYLDEIVIIACGLVNLQDPIIKEF